MLLTSSSIFNIRKSWWVWLLLLLTACGAMEVVEVTEVALEGTAVPSPQPPSTSAPEIAATATAIPAITPAPTQNHPTPITNDPITYAVVFVEANDVLNVRSGPGVGNSIIGTIPPTANEIQITGTGEIVSGSTWVPMQHGALSGWVNSKFLTQVVADELFCADGAVVELLTRFETAVANQDDILLAQLIHPERGLRIRLRTIEGEILLDNDALLNDPTSYNWGNAAGSGEAIIGTPSQILLPLLQADFLEATEVACNQLLLGGTAALTNLPTMYAPINFTSAYRSGDEVYAGLNWGSWAIGIEQWQGQGQYYLSTMVHYQWEP